LPLPGGDEAPQPADIVGDITPGIRTLARSQTALAAEVISSQSTN
jgi:hypothetical protein